MRVFSECTEIHELMGRECVFLKQGFICFSLKPDLIVSLNITSTRSILDLVRYDVLPDPI